MRRAIANFLISREFQLSLFARPLRWFVRRTRRLFSYNSSFLLDIQAIEHPPYAYCLRKAAILANQLGLPRISALEFGAGDGTGLAFMKSFAVDMKTLFGVEIDCYSFSEGAGRAAPESIKDLPYRYKATAESAAPVPHTHVIQGSFAAARAFLENSNPATIGVIFVNDETHAATLRAFEIFEGAGDRPDNFLPRIFVYLPYVTGTSTEMYGTFNGQLAAVEEFNGRNKDVKIAANRNLLPLTHVNYRFHVFFAHLFKHPRYGTYVDSAGQSERRTKARSTVAERRKI